MRRRVILVFAHIHVFRLVRRLFVISRAFTGLHRLDECLDDSLQVVFLVIVALLLVIFLVVVEIIELVLVQLLVFDLSQPSAGPDGGFGGVFDYGNFLLHQAD